jgi:hypothetical protein
MIEPPLTVLKNTLKKGCFAPCGERSALAAAGGQNLATLPAFTMLPLNRMKGKNIRPTRLRIAMPYARTFT